MDSSSASSSERRHSVPETYFGKYRTRSPDNNKEKITKDKSIQTDNKLPNISNTRQSSHSHSHRKPCGHHSHSRRKRFKRMNQGELLNMILKNGQVKLKEKSSSKTSSRRNKGNKCDRQKSESSMRDIHKLENQIMRLFSNNSKETSTKCISDSEYSNLLPNIRSNEYPKLCYSSESMKNEDQELHEAILKLQNGDKIVRNTMTQMFDIENDCHDSRYDNSEEFLICFDDDEDIRSCVLQSLNDTYSKALTTRSSSDYCLSSHATTVTDRTVSTMSIQSSSSPLDEMRMRLINNATEDTVSLPKSPRMFPLVIDAESLLSEPVKSGYISNTQMKLISVHFLDSDSDNNGTNRGFAYRDHSYNMLKPTYEPKEEVVIYEIENENVEKDNPPQQQCYNNFSKNSLISEIKHDPENIQHTSVDRFLFNQPTTSVIKAPKTNEREEKKKDPGKDMSYKSCSCVSAISNVAPQPYRDSVYDTPVVSGVSSLPKSYSMLVNASSKYRDYSSDSSDDEVSNPDSLEDVSSRHRSCYDKYDDKIVRGDTSALALERRPKKKDFSFTPYFITLNGDEVYSLHHMKYKLPEDIKKKLMNRERKLRKHSREKCKHCAKACLVKKIMRKKHHLKAKQQHKLPVTNALSIGNEKKTCSKSYCGHNDSKVLHRKHDISNGHESFDKHTCSNTIVVHEVRNEQNGTKERPQFDSENSRSTKTKSHIHKENTTSGDQYESKSFQNIKKQSSTQTRRDSIINDRRTRMIRNHFTQTSLEDSKTNTENVKDDRKIRSKHDESKRASETIKDVPKSSNKQEESTMTTENIKLDYVSSNTQEDIIKSVEEIKQPLRPQKPRDQVLDPIKKEEIRKDLTVQNKENVPVKNGTSKINNKHGENNADSKKDCCCDSKNDHKRKLISPPQTDLDRSIRSDSRSLSDRSRRVDDEVDKAIMYILLDGLMQGEKENTEKKNKKSIAVQVKSPDTHDCSVHPDSESHRRSSTSKYSRKFDIIPEEESLMNQRDVCGSPLDYTDRVQPVQPIITKKKEPCRCKDDVDTRGDLNKEVEKFEDYLMNKKKSKFHSVEECHPEIREIPRDTAEPRKFSSVSNVSIESIDMINTGCRRHKSNGNNPAILNYKRAMMVGTFTPFNQQEEGSKGKNALTVGEQEELLSKGWINFYLLKGGDSHEFFSDAEDDYTFMPNFEINDALPKDNPAESFNVQIKSKPESVLPVIPNKSQVKPNQPKKVTKPKGAPLPKLNVKPKRENSVPPTKKENAHRNCLIENTDINFMNPKTRRFGNRVTDSQRNKSRQSIKTQKVEETPITETDEQNKNIEFNDCLGPMTMKEPTVPIQELQPLDTPVDSFVSANYIDDFERHKEVIHPIQKEIDHSHKELDPIVNDYDCSIRTLSSISVHSGSDESQKHLDTQKLIDSQKQIVRKSSKPDRERDFPPPSSTKPPCSEHNWKVTVASEKSNDKQTSPNIELHLSMNSSDQSRDRRKSNPRQSNKMNLSLTLKNFCGDSDVSSSSRQDIFYDKEKPFAEHHELYSKKHYKNITQAEDTGSVRSSTAMSFHEDQDKNDFTSSKRNELPEEGLLSVTGSYITPEMRRKPPTMSEKDLSLYKNSKK